MCRLIGISKPAGYLVNLYIIRVRCKRERYYPFIPFLFLHFAEINGLPIYSGRCSRLETIHPDPQRFQTVCKIIGALQTVRSRISAYIPVNASGFKVSPCAEDNRPAAVYRPGICLNACYFSLFRKNFCNLHLADIKIFLIFKYAAHGAAVLSLISLSSERMNCRSFRPVQHFRLDKGPVNYLSHLSAQSINLTNQMPL